MADDPRLDLIKKYESGGQNVPNYIFDPTHTAQGYYQITNTNWNQFAPAVGIDTSKFPDAMSASEEDQRKVAAQMLGQPNGIRNWTDYNPKLKAALSDDLTSVKMPEQQDYTLEELQAEQARRKQATKTTQTKTSVKPPEKGFSLGAGMRALADVSGMSGGLTYPGVEQFKRGFTGPSPQWQTHAADILEGGGRMMLPAAAATLPFAPAATMLGLGGSLVGSQVASSAAPEISKDPETQRLIGDVGGLAGGALGGWGGPKVTRTPVGRAALGVLLGHLTGAPYGMEVGALLGGGAEFLPGRLGKFVRGVGSEAPKAPVSAPKATPMKASVAELNAMHENGVISDSRYGEIRNGSPVTTDELIANQKIEQARRAAEKTPEPQSPVTLTHDPTSSTNPLPPVRVTVPPGFQARPNFPVNPSGPAPSGTGLGVQLTPAPQLPVEPPPPNLGTRGPLPPIPQGPPLSGPAATGTAFSPNLGQTPMPDLGNVGQVPQGLTGATPVSSPLAPAPNLGNVGPLGAPPSGPPASRTPLGELVTPDEIAIRNMVRAAIAKDVKISKNTTNIGLKGTAKKLDLPNPPTKSQVLAAAERLENMERSERPTAEMPGKKKP